MARAGKALDTLRRLGSAVCREPLAHFTVLAALLFAVNALAVGDGRSVIRIDAATQGFLLKQKRDLLIPIEAAHHNEMIAPTVTE